MRFKDQWAVDENGQKYIFTVEMQRRLYELNRPVEAHEWLKFKAENTPPSAPKPKDRETKPEPVRVEVAPMEVDSATGKFVGVLKMYNDAKSFGFIDQGGGKEIYFHKRQLLSDTRFWKPGQRLLYNVTVYRGKEEAVEIEEHLA